ncbi:MAG: ATP-binding protein, partial [Daejeonella sp.]
LIVDPCGENGEFHTFCYSGPIFESELKFKLGETHFAALPVKSQTEEYAGGFWYIDIQIL